jgi:hypothetical protein
MLCECHIKKSGIGGASGTYGRQKRCHQGFGWEARAKETTWENNVKILRMIFKKWKVESWAGSIWLTILVNVVMNLQEFCD